MKRHAHDDTGIALIITLLIMMLLSGLMAGFFAAISADTRSNALDRDQTRAYAAAHAGLEKLTSDLAELFAGDVSPSVSQINALMTNPPDIPGYEYRSPGGEENSGYSVTWKADGNGNPAPDDTSGSNITAGAYRGLKGIITKYPITVTARSITGGAEVRLRREIQTVAVPVFQFGAFSETDMSIYAGTDFTFGGRVHTNGSLFVCQQTNLGTMTFNDRITAVNEVIRNYWSNGLANSSSTPSCTNNVMIPTSASTTRNLKQSPNEGSVVGMPGSTANTNWTSISTGTYKSYIRTGLTGATRLDLPLVSQGAEPVDLIRRPGINSDEDTDNPPVFGQRFFSQASLRILLSDRKDDILDLPTVTLDDPVLLDGNWNTSPPVGYAVDGTHPPIALSPGPSLATVNTKSSSCCNGSYIKTNAALPAEFMVQNLQIGSNTNVVCTEKTQSQFKGCTLGVNVADGATVSATLPSGVTFTTTTSGSTTAGSNRTVSLSTPPQGISGFKTAGFALNTFFIDGAMYTCDGYDTTVPQLSNCSGGTPNNNRAITTSVALAGQGTGTIGGYIKIEKQDEDGDWTDVTMEILNLGFGAPNQTPGGADACADPTPDAVIRLQRLRDNPSSKCPYPASRNPWDWWPQTLYDAREGSFRNRTSSDPMMMGGIMQYVALDVNNLKRWFAGTIGTTGNQALNNNGYIVYFSDRRGNHDTSNSDVETGEYGFEDQVNSNVTSGAPNGTLQDGEDMNGDGDQQLYGRVPAAVGDAGYNNVPSGAVAPYTNDTNSTPNTTLSSSAATWQARINKVVLFRRALKIVNGVSGGATSLPTSGLTIAAENPVYVHGNYNATSTNWSSETHRPAAIIADAITLLSNAWTDANSMANPNNVNSRSASTTYWRFAAVAGKGISFSYCAAACGSPGHLFGTDGGMGNFLRLLELWNISGVSMNYRGSLITLHNNRQATGTFKFPNDHIYTGGTRNFAFDTDFLTPSLLPPGTPMFRDVNTLTFRQILRPTQ